MQETIPISKLKATCLRLLDNINKTGKSIIVTRKGQPIALVTPPPPPPKPDQWLGCMKNQIKITGDIFHKIPFKEALLNQEVAIQSRIVKLPHQDPADRFLAATAVV